MITASSLDRIASCPASAALPQVQTTSDAAARGTAVHLYLERIASGELPEEAMESLEGDVRALCEAIDLDRLPKGTSPEIAYAYDVVTGQARELGRRLGRRYTGIASTEIAGTADAVGVGPHSVFVGDYKTGWSAPKARDSLQLRFLALCAARVYQREAAVVEVIRIRSNGSPWRESAALDVLDLDEVADGLVNLLLRVRRAQEIVAEGRLPDVSEGEHCQFCPAWPSCPAKATMLVRVASGAALDPILSLLPLTPEMAGHAWSKLRESRRVLERLERACHAALDQYGEFPLPSGAVLRKVTEEGNEQLDGKVVFAVVRELHDQEVAEAAIQIEASKAGLERALKSAAEAGKIKPRGRAAAERAVLKAVRDRGGASHPPVTRVVEVEQRALSEGDPPAQSPAEPAARGEA